MFYACTLNQNDILCIPNIMKLPKVLFSISLLGFCTGCATNTHQSDPLEPLNRGIYAFNGDMDQMFLKPLAEGYKATVPAPARTGISNFFSNLDDVVVIANDLLQFKFSQVISDSGRFLVNTTAGLLGIIDLSTPLGMPKHHEDFGQTLGYWGVPQGAYVVIPFFGPSNFRDITGRVGDFFTDPRIYYTDNADVRRFYWSTNSLKAVDTRAQLLDVQKIVDAAAIDEYSYIRDAYLQNREYLIHDGTPPQVKNEEADLFDDLKNNVTTPKASSRPSSP